MVRLLEGYGEHPHTEKQQKIVELLEQVGCASVRELCYFTGVTRAVVDRMRKSGMVELYEELTPRRASSRTAGPTDTEPIRLSPSQQAAFDLLLEVGRSPKAEVSLLHGVTGSGKTQVFLRLIEETLSRGRTALVLIPEISLTPQTVSKFSARFGSLVAVLHSSLSMTERFDEWQRIRSGAARIVVGTRSAVMAPLENIGLIVIDEEQEHTYHSESAPRYHARDIAKHRAVRHRAHLLLCSATPSIESYYYALSGKYHLACLPERYSGNLLPEVLTVDMKTAPLAAGSQTLSEELCEQLRETFERREQAILLLNRARLPHPCQMLLLRGGLPLPQLLDSADLPRRQPADDLPLLRTFGSGRCPLSLLQKRNAAPDRCGNPAGGGRAARPFPGCEDSADGYGHHHVPLCP